MDINEVIVWILMICMVLGGLDRAIGCRFGLGQQFEEGFNAMGPLALAMVGVMSLSPVLARILDPVITPIYSLVGADPSMFAGTLLACDMGGWPLALEMAPGIDGVPSMAAQLSGLILGSMMGPTIVFTIPVALSIIDKKDRGYLAKGILAGMVTIPLGVFVGGLVAGFPMSMVLPNLVPIIVVAVLIALGLWFIPNGMTRGFEVFGKGLVALISIGLVIGVFEELTGTAIMPAGWELIPPSEGIAVVGSIAMMLLGAFPAVHLIIEFASKPLAKAGTLIGVNDTAAGGLIATLANNIPMFQIMKDMDPRGKVVNAAFAVSAAFAFGDHLGFVAGASRDLIFPVIAGKLVAGVTAIVVALLIFGRSMPKYEPDPAQGGAVTGSAVA
ncbi:ethanolamine utilization protein EutH [Xylanimonas allomyrinae]|uniref:Ethanolamine utilization protein EutH n=1 Tax=Xylanimonas allomyrinae TaxID=2509459 RepID=A0A4P6EZ28_9MICO|nr:ethanolamine utilization protein EutH [Xylanimonas allomyrinae]QAY63318.1 ethanolamine utilization protein EutH [Xylanimonas allomyrinae]